MADDKRIALGPAGREIAKNVRHIRGRMSFAELSARMTEVNRPIPVIGLRRIEQGERRVDLDDLIGLARALRVHPIQLVYPVGVEQTVELVPGHVTDTWSAVKSFTGEGPFPAPLGQTADKTVDDPEAPARLPLELYRKHDHHLAEWSRANQRAALAMVAVDQGESAERKALRQQVVDSAEREMRIAEDATAEVRRQMHRHGIIPPAITDVRLKHLNGGEGKSEEDRSNPPD